MSRDCFVALHRVSLQFVTVVLPDRTQLLFLNRFKLCTSIVKTAVHVRIIGKCDICVRVNTCVSYSCKLFVMVVLSLIV